ncbi:MAG: DUF3137 domain-containing protein [Clostridiaceae bacterium]|nr:DUF3137 domain-containing protein [Clostridiaceae bacterium]
MDYKRRVILSLIGLVYDYPEYHPAQFISKESLNFYRIFNEEVSLVIGDDLVLCKQNNVKLYFCEINAWSRDNHLFKGLICVIDFHKTFKGQTVVCAKERNYNKCYNNSEKVYLEDPRFTAVFDTYSTNQVTARYILPPNMMENILELKKRWSLNDFSLNFVDGILFFTIEVSKDLFEPSLGKRQCDFKDIFFYYNILEFTKSIIDILNQERRIWSKRDADTDFTKITLDFMLNLYKLPVCVVCKNMSKDDRKNILYSKEHLGYICAECYLKKKFGEYTEVTSFKDVHREWYILTLERIQTYGYQYRDKSLKESEKYLREGLMLGLKPLYDTNGLVSGWSVR